MKTLLHSFYRWYLKHICGGDHHVGPYGENGRYIVLMTERQYHRYTHLAREPMDMDGVRFAAMQLPDDGTRKSVLADLNGHPAEGDYRDASNHGHDARLIHEQITMGQNDGEAL